MTEALRRGPDPDPLTDPLPEPAPGPPGPGAGPDAASTGTLPPTARGEQQHGPRTEAVTCPECGTRAEATLTRREARDFCVRCDYPLFWTPSTIQLGDRDTAAETLRRLPGTAGRVTVASVPCPHCSEANPLAATTCVRCGLPIVVEAPPPPPAPAPAPPPPAPEPPPAERSLLWLWLLLGATAVVAGLLVWWWVAQG